MDFTVRATVMQTPTRGTFTTLEDARIRVVDGTIVAISNTGEADVTLPPDHVLVPGFIDLHIHAPQWPQLGTGYDLPLSEWLFEHTFPLEARFDDLPFAQQTWEDMVPALLAHGTTTAVYYGSIHTPATTALAEACIHHGQRAWVGRAAMDHPEGTPEWYRDDDADTALAATRESIAQIGALDDPHNLVHPIITPRFIPACTDELLTGLGALAAETGIIVQTHCSEDDWEHHHVIERTGQRDTDALDSFGLLRPSTVLGHGVHLNAEDFATIRDRGAGVAHCPLSNVYFGNAVFPAAQALDAGVHVGLGTDVAGGPSASVLANAARAVDSSRMLEDGVDASASPAERGVQGSRIDAFTAFWLATMGGGSVLDEPLGLIEEGRRFDAVAVSLAELAPSTAGYTPERRFEQLVRLAGRREITDVWVDGRQVIGDL
ncbi:MAG: amidohydrolase family protein [Acidimicrobiales bacterium]|nr:amidohydrolase family protein [Acidimicrobiales bacterium]RZV43117.1 MAG: guanine deaminase [Acidimicrobiales bacterium]